MYVVEIRRDGDRVAALIADMRTWLDDERVQPKIFRLSMIPDGTIFHLEFNSVSEAEEFARAFAGRVFGDERIAAE